MKLSTTLFAIGMGTGLVFAINVDGVQAKGPGGKPHFGVSIGQKGAQLSINSGSVKFHSNPVKINTIHNKQHNCHIDWCYSYHFAPTYTHYCNPYVLVPVEAIPVVAVDSQLGETQQGLEFLAAAREAFLAHQFRAALSNVDHALVEMPNNPNAHQLKSLTLFAIGKFREAAGVAHVALTSGRTWNWPTLRSNYVSGNEYAAQLRRLEIAAKMNPADAAPQFLLGYHYMMMGHAPQAMSQLQNVVRLEGRDQLAAQMLTVIGGNTGMSVDPNAGQPIQQPAGQIAQQGAPIGQQGAPMGQQGAPMGQQIAQTQQQGGPIMQQGAPVEQGVVEGGANAESGNPALNANPNGPAATVEPAPAPGNIAAGQDQANIGPVQGNVEAPKQDQSAGATDLVLIGSFKAAPAEGIAIQVDLREDGTFTWTVDAKGQKKTFSGKFTLEENKLSLARENDGQKMVGALTPANANSFNFKLQNAKEKDTGLTFNRI